MISKLAARGSRRGSRALPAALCLALCVLLAACQVDLHTKATEVDANEMDFGDQQFAFIGDAAFSGAAGELRAYQDDANTYVEGDTDGDGVADFMIRLDGLHSLSGSDFLL